SGATQPGLSVDALRQAVMRANAALHAEGDAQPAYKGMGTTLTVLHVAGVSQAQATLVHVGDSRAYLHRAGALFQLTKDHSWVEDEVRAGRLSAQDAPAHPMRHVLTRALGIATQVEPEFLTLGLQAGDQLLLCTDGLTKMMNDEEIAATLARSNRHPQAACDALVREANERGGRDNVTVLIVGDHIM
ncbi:MAG: SpoIIE family protein phosphatase, partial [Nitrospiraceae bacterium]